MLWEYIDSNAKTQGPFEESKMINWIKQNLLPSGLKTRKFNSGGHFEPIKLIDEFRKYVEEAETKISSKSANSSNKRAHSGLIGNASTLGPPPLSKELHWLYIDSDEKLQGPFANSLMRKWLEDGHFDDSLRVLKYFTPISEKVQIDPKNLIVGNYKPIKDLTDCDILKKWEDTDKLNWFYLDEQNNEQGPFSSKTMLKWVQRGFIPPSLQIRPDISTSFYTFGRMGKPFGSKFSEKPSWSFLDDKGTEHGQFPTSMMSLWLLCGFLANHTPCRNPSVGPNFIPLREIRMHFTKTQDQTMEQMDVPLPRQCSASTQSDSQWFYIDLDNGRQQGPFSSEAMKNWHAKGFLPDFIKVKRRGEASFIPIKERSDCDFVEPSGIERQFRVERQAALPPSAFNVVPSRMPYFIREPSWFFVDQTGVERGPFPSEQMRAWWFSGNFSPQILVRAENEMPHMAQPVQSRDCCFKHRVEDLVTPRAPALPPRKKSGDPTIRVLKRAAKKIEQQKKVVNNMSKLSSALDEIDEKRVVKQF